jgi:hypothetical protein
MTFVVGHVDWSSSLFINMCTLKHNIIAMWMHGWEVGFQLWTNGQKEGGKVVAYAGFNFEVIRGNFSRVRYCTREGK